MPKLESARQGRRKAENDVLTMKARLRLLQDLADKHEKKAKRDREVRQQRGQIQDDAAWGRETQAEERLRRDAEEMGRRVTAAAHRDLTHAQLSQSKQLVAQQRSAAARATKEELQERLGAAYSQKQEDWERRRLMAEERRQHKRWHKAMADQAAAEFTLRNAEIKAMGMAEEETRRWMVHSTLEAHKDAIALEVQRVNEAKQSRDHTAREAQLFAKSSVIDPPPHFMGPGGQNGGPASALNAGFGGGGFGVGGGGGKRKITSYQIAGPGMALVTRTRDNAGVGGGNGKGGGQQPTQTLHRVHFPFGRAEEAAFAFQGLSVSGGLGGGLQRGAFPRPRNVNPMGQTGRF